MEEEGRSVEGCGWGGGGGRGCGGSRGSVQQGLGTWSLLLLGGGGGLQKQALQI